ncbi:hypothetical protein LPJ66_000257 [Kickxella alabastrina]|uniref:Uncharacterized protein n=1 Tax=Kickxella alabastrina TaxID=61397 RepID=A0ACC1IWT2_9FUNG|nr:hypothetical protein LPJ66_000257 [Kickxella alabastrina]
MQSVSSWQNYRRKSTLGVSATMLYFWYFGSMLYGAFAVAKDLYIGLIIQPQLLSFFALINILQIYWYRYKFSKIKVALICAFLCAAYAGLHVGMWKATEKAIDRGQEGAVTFLGVLPAIVIAIGFFPEFYECFKEQSVEMSNFFIMLDMMGGIFSTISLAFDYTFDYIASITYLIVILLDFVLAAMKVYYYMRGTQGAGHRAEKASRSAENGASIASKRSIQKELASKGLEEC